MSELLLCPFCGGEAYDHAGIIVGGKRESVHIICSECGAKVYGVTEQSAIAAWNTRAERTCKLIEHSSLANWPDMVCWSCSVCGFGWHHSRNDKQFNYCPNCGAKVVDHGE